MKLALKGLKWRVDNTKVLCTLNLGCMSTEIAFLTSIKFPLMYVEPTSFSMVDRITRVWSSESKHVIMMSFWSTTPGFGVNRYWMHSEPCQTSNKARLGKRLLAINYFRKELQLRCLTGFWIASVMNIDLFRTNAKTYDGNFCNNSYWLLQMTKAAVQGCCEK